MKITQISRDWHHPFSPEAPRQKYPVNARTWSYSSGFREMWHAHSQVQLFYVTKGVIRVLTHDGIWTLPPHHAMWMPPGIPHELHSVGDVAVRSAYIEVDTDERVAYRNACDVVVIDALLDSVIGGIAEAQKQDDTQRNAVLMPVFFHELFRAKTVNTGAINLPSDRRLKLICEQLIAAPANNDTIDRWGERVGASQRTLARLFRDETGMSFVQWRQQWRLSEAVTRLALGTPVATIACDLGYANVSAFIAMFKKTLGETPQRYLKRGDTE